MPRRKFSETEVLMVAQLGLWRQGVDLICYRCHAPLFTSIVDEKQRIISATKVEKIDREHITEIALGGVDSPANCAYSHASCHSIITNGSKATSAGSSKQRIAKVKRLRGEVKGCPKVKWVSRAMVSAKKPWPKRSFQKKRSP